MYTIPEAINLLIKSFFIPKFKKPVEFYFY
jgi:hypothetical protein